MLITKRFQNLLLSLLIFTSIFSPFSAFAGTFDDNTNHPIRNLFLDVNAKDVIRLEIKKAQSALTVVVENRDTIVKTLGVLQSVKMEEPFPYKIKRDNSGEIIAKQEDILSADGLTYGHYVAFNGKYDYHLKFVEQSGKSRYAYMSNDFYGFFYFNGRVAQFGTQKNPDTFYNLLSDIDVHLKGQPITLDFSSEGWPDKVHDDNGIRQINSIMVGISKLAYKNVTKAQDVAELTRLTQSLNISSGNHFLSASSFGECKDLTNATTVATFTPPNVKRRSYDEINLYSYASYNQNYHLLYDRNSDRYYLGYFNYMDLPIEKSSAEELLRFVKKLDYAEKSDNLTPDWWSRASYGM